jgi:hypothetical protein
MFKEFFQVIRTRLQTEIPTIKTIDVFNNQFENEPNEKPFRFPAVFFEFVNLPYRSEVNGIQKIDVEFTLHVATSELRQSFDLWDLCEQIGTSLHNYSGDNFSDITQRNAIPDNDHDRINIWRLTFGCTITDDTKFKPGKQTVVSGISLNITRDLDIDNVVIKTGDGL